MCEHAMFDNPPHENLKNEGQRTQVSRTSRVFPDFKSFPDLGMIFRSILDRFGSNFGSILVKKMMSKIDTKNKSEKQRKITNFGAKMVSSPSPKPESDEERKAAFFFVGACWFY